MYLLETESIYDFGRRAGGSRDSLFMLRFNAQMPDQPDILAPIRDAENRTIGAVEHMLARVDGGGAGIIPPLRAGRIVSMTRSAGRTVHRRPPHWSNGIVSREDRTMSDPLPAPAAGPKTGPRDAGTVDPRPAKILIIDDDERVLRFCARALSSTGYEVATASDPVAGLDMALHGGHDLVILDLTMPRMPGLDVLEHLVRDRPRQAVIVVSCQADRRTRTWCFELGAADYLAKPFTLGELRDRVDALARAPSHTPAWSMANQSVDTVGARISDERRAERRSDILERRLQPGQRAAAAPRQERDQLHQQHGEHLEVQHLAIGCGEQVTPVAQLLGALEQTGRHRDG